MLKKELTFLTPMLIFIKKYIPKEDNWAALPSGQTIRSTLLQNLILTLKLTLSSTTIQLKKSIGPITEN